MVEESDIEIGDVGDDGRAQVDVPVGPRLGQSVRLLDQLLLELQFGALGLGQRLAELCLKKLLLQVPYVTLLPTRLLQPCPSSSRCPSPSIKP